MLIHKGTQSIETERLILRRFRMDDCNAMFENWANDHEVTRYLSWPTHENVDTSRAVLTDWVASYEKEDFYLWAITIKSEGDSPIGSISAFDINNSVAKIEIGYCIGKKWWRKGIMTEALGAVMSFLFDNVGFNRIQACHDPRNPNSGKVMTKCGMKFEGTLRQEGRNNQGICDVSVYAQLKGDR